MLFNSLQAAAIVGVTFALYWRLGQRQRLWLLLGVSAVFYASFDWRFLALLTFVIMVAYVTAPRLAPDAGGPRRQWMTLAVATNLAVLAVFKYADFFVGSFAELVQAFGLEPTRTSLELLLPVGISFYTFQAIGYSADVYRGRIEPERDFVTFATFLAFFPQLVAGPIERGERLLPQIRSLPHRLRPGDIQTGVNLIVLGLFRKVVIADTMAIAVQRSYTEDREFFGATFTVEHSWMLVLTGMFAFGAQIYGDFAGYSTIARGMGKLFGIDLSTNFQRPLWAPSLGALWRRWHITLISILRDFVYFPVRRAAIVQRHLPRGGRYLATFLVFLVAGVWHGPEAKWLVWGALTGAVLMGELWWTSVVAARRRASVGDSSGASLRAFVLAVLTATAFVVIGAPVGARDMEQVWEIWGAVATLDSGLVLYDVVAITAFCWIALLLTDRHEVRVEQAERWWHERGGGRPLPGREVRPPLESTRWAVRTGAMMLGVVLFSGGTPIPYFYFAF